jgi:hypothetical protein
MIVNDRALITDGRRGRLATAGARRYQSSRPIIGLDSRPDAEPDSRSSDF